MLNGGDPRTPLLRHLADNHPHVKVPANPGHEELLRIIDYAEGRPSPAEARALDHSKQQPPAHKRDTGRWDWKTVDQRIEEHIAHWREIITTAVGRHVGERDAQIMDDYRAKIAALEAKIAALEARTSLDARFSELEARLAARQLALNEAKGGSIQQSELLARIDRLQRQLGDPKRIADLDARFRGLAERVGELEKTSSLEARFAKLAHEANQGSEIPQDELLEKIEALQRQVDELKRVADLDARFGELTERIGELEKANSLEARFTKLAHEVKNRCELPRSELLARIDGLERQLDDLKRVPGQPGPPGPPGKLPRVKEYVAECVHYEGDVVTHAGALWQARGDTVHAPPHADWICVARAGRNGCDGRSPNVCGTYDAREKYERLDIVALDGAAFIARRDNPGICPGDGWQLLSRPGRPGHRGETGERGVRGEKGEKGEPGVTVVSWLLDRQRYRISPLMSDGKVGPMLELRGLFEQFLSETS